MPPKVKVTKEEMVDCAVSLVRSSGVGALNARALATALGCSTQPIFSNFSGMEALKLAVADRAVALFNEFTQKEIASGKYPPYKATGMAYIRFATEEPRLFSALFLRARTEAEQLTANEDWRTACARVAEQTGLPLSQAELFQLEMWSCVHGIATMQVSGYLSLSEAQISDMLSDLYLGLCSRFEERKDQR